MEIRSIFVQVGENFCIQNFGTRMGVELVQPCFLVGT